MSAFAEPVLRPVRHAETKLLVDGATGEIVGREGLNDDPERCPADLCGGCSRYCACAPCRCDGCEAREAFTRRARQPRGQAQIVLL